MAKTEKVMGKTAKTEKAVTAKPKEDKTRLQQAAAPEKKAEKSKIEKAAPRKKPNAIRRYFTESIGELKKVKWPTRKEATSLTIVVLLVMLAMSLLLGGLDFLFTELFGLII